MKWLYGAISPMAQTPSAVVLSCSSTTIPPRSPISMDELSRASSSRGLMLALATTIFTGRSSRPSLRKRKAATGEALSMLVEPSVPTKDSARAPQWTRRPTSSILPTRASWPPWSIFEGGIGEGEVRTRGQSVQQVEAEDAVVLAVLAWRHTRMGANSIGGLETEEASADDSSALHVVLFHVREHVLQVFNRLSQ